MNWGQKGVQSWLRECWRWIWTVSKEWLNEFNSFLCTGPRDDPVLRVGEIHLAQTAFILLEVGLQRISSVKVFVCLFLIYYFLIFYCCSVIIVPISPPLLSPVLSSPHSQRQSPHHCPCAWVLCMWFFEIMSLLSADSTRDGHARLLYSLQSQFLTTSPHLFISWLGLCLNITSSGKPFLN